MMTFTDLSRHWVMPSQWTFSMKPVQQCLEKYQVGTGWVDPFAGLHSPAEFTNDCEAERNAKSTMDALEFLKTLPDGAFTGVLFDPPYSVEQCLRCYTPKQGGTAGRAEYWARCKDQIARIVKPGGLSIAFGWDSTGVGKTRGFDIIEVMLLCHGACHNDTIVTIERRRLTVLKGEK
jgi:hypothetical protein